MTEVFTANEMKPALDLLIKYAADANELVRPASDSDADLDTCLKIHMLLNAVVIGLQSMHGGYGVIMEELQYHLDNARDYDGVAH